MKLSMQSIEKDGFVKLAADGSITAADLDQQTANPVASALGPNWATFRVLLDMGNVSYIDSSAIGWLIGVQKEFKQHGGGFAVYGVQPGVRQVLELLKVGKVVPLADTEAAARAALNGGQA